LPPALPRASAHAAATQWSNKRGTRFYDRRDRAPQTKSDMMTTKRPQVVVSYTCAMPRHPHIVPFPWCSWHRRMREILRPWRSHRAYRTCWAEQYWKSFSCVVRRFLRRPAGHSVLACRWSLGSPRSRECGDPLSRLSMSARTNARRLWWRYKHSTPATARYWRRWTH